MLIAESDLNDPRVVTARRELGGYGLDAQWSDDFHHALHTVLTGERDGYYADFGSLADFAKALQRGFCLRRTLFLISRSPARQRPAGLPGPWLSWAIRRTTTKSATAPRASAAVI